MRKQGKATCQHFTDAQNRHSQFIFNYIIVDKFHFKMPTNLRCNPLLKRDFQEKIFPRKYISLHVKFTTFFIHPFIHSFIYLHSPLHDWYTTTGHSCQ